MKTTEFITSPIRRFKLIKIGKIRISPIIIALSALIMCLIALSTISINDADAVYVRNGEFQIGMVLSDYSMYTGDNLNITIFFTNLSSQNKLITFSRGCQATYKIYDEKGNLYYPLTPQEMPCNNKGFEEFIMSPGQLKRYYFSLVNILGKPTVFKVGKYSIVGIVDGFGETPAQQFEVLEKPKFHGRVQEGELCNGISMQRCDKGLECRYEGGFPGGAGMCFAVDDPFSPENKCNGGNNNCLSDTVSHPNFETIQKYLINGQIQGALDGNFYPDAPITMTDFINLTQKISGKKVNYNTNQNSITRIEALKILYKIYFESEPEISLEESPFLDMQFNKDQNYTSSAYKLGILHLNSERKFYPDLAITRAQALVLIDRFQNF